MTTQIKTKDRDSNIELLRIVCMAMIIAHHLVIHGGVLRNGAGQWRNLVWGALLQPGGKIGFDCFIVISAWYGIGRNFKAERFLKIAMQVVFYNVFGLLLTGWAVGFSSLSVRTWFGALFPIFGNSHGFATAYLLFMLIMPFLNAVQDRLSTDNLKLLMALLFGMQVWSGLFAGFIRFERWMSFESELNVFALIYFAVCYVKKRPAPSSGIPQRMVWVGVLVFGWLAAGVLNALSVLRPESSVLYAAKQFINDEFSPLNVAAGFCLFFLFKEMRVVKSVRINCLAGHTLGILLLHDHEYFRESIWRILCVEKAYSFGGVSIFLYTLAVVTGIFALGALIDSLRVLFLEKAIVRTKLFAKAAQWIGKYAQVDFKRQ